MSNLPQLAFVQLGVGLLALVYTIWHSPFKQLARYSPRTWSKIQRFHSTAILLLLIKECLNIIDFILILVWHLSHDIRVDSFKRVGWIVQYGIIPIFAIVGSLTLYYAILTYRNMIIPSISSASHQNSTRPLLNTSSAPRHKSLFQSIVYYSRPHLIRVSYSVCCCLAFWMFIVVLLSDTHGIDELSIKMARVLAIASYCSYIILYVCLIEMRLIYVILDEAAAEPQSTKLHLSQTKHSLQTIFARYFHFAQNVSFVEKCKLLGFMLFIILTGMGTLSWYIWGEFTDDDRLHFYFTIPQSIASLLISQIYQVISILHKALNRIRDTARESARMAALNRIGHSGTLSMNAVTSSTTPSEVVSKFNSILK